MGNTNQHGVGLEVSDEHARAGGLGDDCLVYLHDDDTVSLGRGVYAEWEGDNFTLRSPHVGGAVSGGPASLFLRRVELEVPTGRARVVPVIRQLRGLPRGTRLPIRWEPDVSSAASASA